SETNSTSDDSDEDSVIDIPADWGDDDDDDDSDDNESNATPKTKPSQSSPEREESQKSTTSSKGGGIKTTKNGLSMTFSDEDDKDGEDEEEPTPRRPRSNSRKELEDEEDDRYSPVSKETRQERFSSGKRKTSRKDHDESMESESESGSDSRKRRSSSSRKKKLSKRRQREESSGSESSDSGSDSSSYEARRRRRKKKHPRNPLAQERQEQKDAALRKLQSPASSSKKPSQDDSDDGFMSDCDPPAVEPAAEEPTKAKKKRDLSGSADSGENKKRKKRKKSRRDYDRDDDVSRELSYDNGYGNDDFDDDNVDHLHPIFEDPKFPPSELTPLILGDTDGKEVSVPASLSRYLAPFQKEGVEFLYKVLSRNSGVILGDDMVLGKTIQVIALLCALFDKSGTGKDLKEMKERNKKVAKHIADVRRLRDEAFKRGELVEEDFDKWTETLGVSSWHPVLVIVPPAVVSNWLESFEMFSYFSVSEYTSSRAQQALDGIRYGSADLLLCRESLFKSADHFARINTVNWKLVVVDEFHSFKNPDTKASKHVRELKKTHSPLMLGMTGTLMQNNHKELWNLVDLIQTGFLGDSKEFNQTYDRTISRGRQKGINADAEKRGEEAAKRLRSKVKSIMIERKKEDVLRDELPDKDEQLVLCSLSKLQKEVYSHVIELPDFELVKTAQAPCDCGINQNFFRKFNRLSNKAERLEFYRSNKDQITKQSKCCKRIPINPEFGEDGEPKIDPDALMKLGNHLGLLQADKSSVTQGMQAKIKYKKDREFAKVALAGVVKKLPGGDYDRHESMLNDHFALSGKLETTDRLLTKYQKEGCKVLLFSHSTQTLDLIEDYVKFSRGSMEYVRLDGSINTKNRKERTDRFQSDPSVFLFLLSTKACGLGLNLTAANRVILFDQNWNPSWEDQAQDRAYRIGQTEDVHVVRLVAQGTVDEMIYIRQIYKKMLKQGTMSEDEWSHLSKIFRGVQGDNDRKGELFGYENLFKFKDGSFLDDIWKGSGRKKDSSGLKIHKMGEIANVLKDSIGVQEELDAIENVEILEALSQRVDVDNDKKPKADATKDSFDLHEADTDDESDSEDKPIAERVRVMPYHDIFRSDKGDAAIPAGEDGYEEEMGGGTQNAFAVYEKKKDELSDDDSDDGAASVGVASLHSASSHASDGDPEDSQAAPATASKPAPNEVTSGPSPAAGVAQATDPSQASTPDPALSTQPEPIATTSAAVKSDPSPTAAATSVPDPALSTQPGDPQDRKVAAKKAPKSSYFKNLS
ncbi:MAG: hypothetical protein SGILL_006986, partial [Bacillariaceae sp.]